MRQITVEGQTLNIKDGTTYLELAKNFHKKYDHDIVLVLENNKMRELFRKVKDTGACAQGFAEIDGESYYFNDSCEMVKGWITIDKNRYHFADDGKMTKGWYEEPPEKYYFKGDGSAGKGFTKIKDKYYYFDKKNRLLSGWNEIGGNVYYFGRGGVVADGWEDIDEDTYYFDKTTHVAATGWTNTDQYTDDEKKKIKEFKSNVSKLVKFEKDDYFH